MILRDILVSISLLYFSAAAVDLNRDGCGETKGCLFKPAGCNPQRDCTLGIIFYVSEPNYITIQVTATTLIPLPNLQYVAIGFSNDSHMGADMVSECVMSPRGDEFGLEPEVFVSYNVGKSNDRTFLNATEHEMLIRNVEGNVINGRMSCSWSQQIIPQMSSKNGRIWNLNEKYYILGATGAAQPDEVLAHDTSLGSHFYPMVSARPINPSVIGTTLYDLPPPYVEPAPTKATAAPIAAPEVTTQTAGGVMPASNTVLCLVFACFTVTLAHYM